MTEQKLRLLRCSVSMPTASLLSLFERLFKINHSKSWMYLIFKRYCCYLPPILLAFLWYLWWSANVAPFVSTVLVPVLVESSWSALGVWYGFSFSWLLASAWAFCDIMQQAFLIHESLCFGNVASLPDELELFTYSQDDDWSSSKSSWMIQKACQTSKFCQCTRRKVYIVVAMLKLSRWNLKCASSFSSHVDVSNWIQNLFKERHCVYTICQTWCCVIVGTGVGIARAIFAKANWLQWVLDAAHLLIRHNAVNCRQCCGRDNRRVNKPYRLSTG